ncbi:hypothetical protein FDP22_20545 (plasmid) [Paroceanicella profunda]|uniref:Capsular biosynthesis protein n=1 Tax=Paroceanicella profunda TaxID=2579971 RepID=A0A5B8G4K3_9RHOB|nr:hypothetical protein [Paroceanicella profunda]QDL94232.1 hypothetical protein FDP22_20545 [Paroceanicella profunda]
MTAGPFRLAAYALRDGLILSGFCATLALARLLAGPLRRRVALGLFISANKGLILAHDAPGALRLRARILKARDPRLKLFHRLGGAAARRLLAGAPERLRLYCWGYADIEILGSDLSAPGRPVYRLETGLLGHGAAQGDAVVSYVLDTRAPYFDGRRPTDLEELLEAYPSGDWRRLPDTRRFVEEARESRFQKYAGIDAALDAPVTAQDTVVVGQVSGDMALQATTLAVPDNVSLVARAVAEAQGTGIWYKAHPFNRANAAECAEIARRFPEVRMLGAGVSFAQVAHLRPTVYVLTSGAGLEAALRGCRVVCFGAAYYAGWGATEDRVSLPRRRNRLTAEDIFFVTMHEYARYFSRRTLETLPARAALSS